MDKPRSVRYGVGVVNNRGTYRKLRTSPVTPPSPPPPPPPSPSNPLSPHFPSGDSWSGAVYPPRKLGQTIFGFRGPGNTRVAVTAAGHGSLPAILLSILSTDHSCNDVIYVYACQKTLPFHSWIKLKVNSQVDWSEAPR